MKVLSLFDGMSCGRIALERAGINVEEYYASEINNHSIQVSKDNYPDIKHIGNVLEVIGSEYDVDLLIAGSPCQGFSFIGKGLNFDDPRSKLFFEFVRILEESKPKYFLLENVRMKKEYQDIISKYLGVEPVEINSNLVSAQNRKRLYWTNIPNISLPKDKRIFLDDVIDHSYKDYVVPKNWHLRIHPSKPNYCDPYNKSILTMKSNTLRTNVNNGNMWVKVIDGYRNLSREETELLQTVPVGYTKLASERQAKIMLSNGWTVDVIAHIFRGIK